MPTAFVGFSSAPRAPKSPREQSTMPERGRELISPAHPRSVNWRSQFPTPLQARLTFPSLEDALRDVHDVTGLQWNVGRAPIGNRIHTQHDRLRAFLDFARHANLIRLGNRRKASG